MSEWEFVDKIQLLQPGGIYILTCSDPLPYSALERLRKCASHWCECLGIKLIVLEPFWSIHGPGDLNDLAELVADKLAARMNARAHTADLERPNEERPNSSTETAVPKS